VRKLKLLRSLLCLVLVLAIHASGMTAELCLCVGDGSQGFLERSEPKRNHIFHMRCTGSDCKGCSVEDGQSLKTANIPSSNADIRPLDASWGREIFSDSVSHSYIIKAFTPDYAFLKSYPPISLRNLSLLF